MAIIRGSRHRDVLSGSALSDEILGLGGRDVLNGGQSDDSLSGDAGEDVLFGGSGNDRLSGGDARDKLFGGSGDDKLYGDNGRDILNGGNGDDRLFGGNDNDRLFGGRGADRLYGGSGNDFLAGGEDADYFNGGSGIDTVNYSRSRQAVAVNLTAGNATGGDATGDTFASVENIVATRYSDQLTGSGANNAISGGAGNDLISGLGGRDVLNGGSGNDEIYGGDDDDLLIGGSGNDQLYGGAGDDVLRPGAGADTIDGGSGYNTLDYSDAAGGIFLLLGTGTAGGAAFGDTFANIQKVIGSAFNDVVTASASGPAETIDGRGGDDTLIANQVSGERLIGGDGNDQLIGAEDNADQFQLQRGQGADYIFGFDATNVVLANRDLLVIDGDAFGTGSALDPSELVTVLDGAGPQFLQQTSGGDLLLYFDADGVTSTQGLMLVARLSGVTSLSVDDFLVV
ncbi:MAG: calcium-binding protein [Hyphomicrobiaceae bacterium]